MRVAIDGRWWADGPPSGRGFLKDVVRQWSVCSSIEDDLTVWSDSDGVKDLVGENLSPQLTSRAFVPSPVSHVDFALRMSLVSRNYDVVFSQNFATPSVSAISAVFIHDAIFVSHPEWFTRMENVYLRVIPFLARFSGIVFTSSRCEAERIVAAWPFLSGRVEAVGLGVRGDLVAAQPSLLGSDVESIPENFILCVGRLNIRKNLRAVLRAFVILSAVHPALHLVVVGEPDGKTEAMIDVPAYALRRIQFRGFVSDSLLRTLYARASVFAFVSRDEGFGLPLVEAAAFGRAFIVSSDIPVFREVAVSDAYVGVDDTDGLVHAIDAGLSRDREVDGDRSDSVLARFSYESVVERLRARLMQEVARRS